MCGASPAQAHDILIICKEGIIVGIALKLLAEVYTNYVRMIYISHLDLHPPLARLILMPHSFARLALMVLCAYNTIQHPHHYFDVFALVSQVNMVADQEVLDKFLLYSPLCGLQQHHELL